jgi:hypothetical protein
MLTNEPTASADVQPSADTAAPVNEPAASDDPLGKLTSFFSGSEQQVENSGEEGNDAADPAAATDEPDAAKPDATADAPEAPAAAEGEASEQHQADFDSLSKKNPDFLDEEGLKAKFPRNSSKELIAEAARYSAVAREATDQLERIGGDAFIEPLENIVSGLREGKSQTVFQGIVEASGSDALLTVVGDALALAMLNSSQMTKSDDPYTAQFGTALGQMADKVIQSRFGESVTVEKLEQLSKLADAGWLEAIEKWGTDGIIDRDEAEKLLQASNDPKLREQLVENARLKKELEERSARERERSTQAEREFDTAFSKSVADEIGKALSSTVWKTSPLAEQPKDTDEQKAEKAFLRERLIQDAINAFDQSDHKGKLIAAYKQGKSSTATFRTDLTNAVASAILSTKPQTARAEGMLVKLYGKSHNAKLAQPKSDPKQPGNLTPTQPTTPADDAGNKKTGDEILSAMEQRIAALG